MLYIRVLYTWHRYNPKPTIHTKQVDVTLRPLCTSHSDKAIRSHKTVVMKSAFTPAHLWLLCINMFRGTCHIRGWYIMHLTWNQVSWLRQVVLTMQTSGVSTDDKSLEKKNVSWNSKVLSVCTYSSTLKLHAFNNLMTQNLKQKVQRIN